MLDQLQEEIKSLAIIRYPNEMVGYVLDGVFIELDNISKTPTTRYQLNIEDKLFVVNNNIDYLVHSHPILDNSPSEADVRAQKTTKIPFAIVGTDGVKTTEIKEIM